MSICAVSEPDPRVKVKIIISPLTPRQVQVLQCLVEGKSYKQIAELLVIKRDTVKKHVEHAALRLGAGSRDQAVAFAVALGLVVIPCELRFTT